MRSDDRPMARPMDNQARPQAAARAAAAEDAPEMERDEAPREEKRERPMTVAERQDEENKKFFKEENEKIEKLRQESKALEADAKGADFKLWRVHPVDPNAAPFMFSNIQHDMYILAQSEKVARRVAMQRHNDAVWEDENQVVAEEFKGEGVMILVPDQR